MFTTSGSTALSVWLSLITLATTIHRSAGQPLQVIACNQPDSFTVQLTENKNVVVHDTELLIKYDPHAEIYPLGEVDAVNVVYNESTIEFRGYMSPATIPSGSPERLSWTSSGIILGTGTLQKLSSGDYAVRECRLFLPKNIKSSGNLPFAVEDEIANHARYCIEEYLCRQLGPIKTEEPLENIEVYRRGAPPAPASHAFTSDDSPQNCTASDGVVDLNINEAVNLAIRAAIRYIKQNNKSSIVIPDVDESHELGPFGMKCYFEAFGGNFDDLSTLKRTDDAYLSSLGRTHGVKYGFGLGLAKFHYNHYKVKYGLMSINGMITGAIDGLAISARLHVDYDRECPVTLESLKVTEFGDIKIRMTGMGPMNSMTSKILTWLTNWWRNNIVSLIEVNVKQVIQEQLSTYVCINYITSMFS